MRTVGSAHIKARIKCFEPLLFPKLRTVDGLERGVASAYIVTTDFSPLKKHRKNEIRRLGIIRPE